MALLSLKGKPVPQLRYLLILFQRSKISTGTVVSFDNASIEIQEHLSHTNDPIDELHPVIHTTLTQNRKSARDAAS